MSELLRFHAPRNPENISKENFSRVVIDSHPLKYRSDRFLKWLDFCSQKDYISLERSMIGFLKSDHSITSINDYQENISQFLKYALATGKNITKDDFLNAPQKEILVKERGLLFNAIERTSDTFLATIWIRYCRDIKGISYQDNLKILFFFDYITDIKSVSDQINLNDFLVKQIALPPCFFNVNPCTKKIENRASFFSLDIKSQSTPDVLSNVKPIAKTDCECIADDKCVPQNPCCATIKPYITDLMVVREEVKSYEPGELSYIENVLMGENRTRKHRHLESTEVYEEQEMEFSRSLEKDLQGSQTFSLKQATDETIKQDISLDAGVTFTATLGKVLASTSLSSNFNSSYDWSKSAVQQFAQEYSKNVVMRALTKVEEKMRDLVARKQIIEIEEKNTHLFNNMLGDDNISGQYFCVNKISRAQVFNYGKRLLCDILLPEPSELFKRLIAKQFNFNLKEPEKPTITPKAICAANYTALIQKYGLIDCAPIPKMAKSISVKIKHFQGLLPIISTEEHSETITVPEDFVTASMSSQKIFTHYQMVTPWSLEVCLGGESVYYGSLGQGIEETQTSSTDLPPLEGIQTLSIQSSGLIDYFILLTVNFKLRADLESLWQMSIYSKIIEVYEKQKEEYDVAYSKAVEEFEKIKAAKYNRNAFLNRETERIELKQMAISYISCKFYDEMNAMKNKVPPCGFPQMDLEETEREGRWVQFFEQAFEWPLMTYLFYPYFWGRKCTWVDKMKETADDPIFEKFLQSGFAKLQVPVRPGFEELVAYFLSFGKIWEGNDIPPVPGDSYYVSMAQEIREQKVNFYADREGTLQFLKDTEPDASNNVVTLVDTNYYWDGINDSINQENINADIDREIIIDCKVFRIVSITETNPADPDHKTWSVTIDRKYEEESFSEKKWSTGAEFIGAPWEFTTPTQLVWLRGNVKCLPSYPIKCQE